MRKRTIKIIPFRIGVIVSQDIERIATTITIIDADVSDCFNSINKINSLRIPSELVCHIDTELKIKCCH